MADLLRIRAKNGTGITWEWVDETMIGCQIQLDQPPAMTINDGIFMTCQATGLIPLPCSAFSCGCTKERMSF